MNTTVSLKFVKTSHPTVTVNTKKPYNKHVTLMSAIQIKKSLKSN